MEFSALVRSSRGAGLNFCARSIGSVWTLVDGFNVAWKLHEYRVGSWVGCGKGAGGQLLARGENMQLTAAFILATMTGQPATPATPIPHQQIALLCFYKGEQISGLNKICYYDCAGSLTTINVKSFQLCPLNIQN